MLINDDNLQMNEIEEFRYKVRAMLIDDENRLLVANYGNIFLFPGGSIDEGEDIEEAITRELKEETGIVYDIKELKLLTKLEFFQRNYLKRNGKVKNRLISTYYFLGSYKDIDLTMQQLTEKERKDNFKLELIPLSIIKQVIIENKNDNPRKVYFQREMLEVIDLLTNKTKGKTYKNIKRK